MILSDSVLIESKSARDNQLARVSHDRAQEVLNKVKSLYFALWQGIGTCTTEQVADFYEVPADNARQLLKTYRDEFESDGVKTLRGKTLRDVRDLLSLTSAPSNLTIWTPRAALRLGMLLRDSEVAKQVRTSLLDAVEHVIPAQAQELEKLKLQLALAQTQERLIAAAGMLAVINPALPALAFGQPGAVVTVTEEVPTTVTVDESGQPIAKYDGVSITYLAKKYGFGTGRKATDRCKAWLKSIGVEDSAWIEEPTAHLTRKLPRELMSYLDQQFAGKAGSRQQLIGEG